MELPGTDAPAAEECLRYRHGSEGIPRNISHADLEGHGVIPVRDADEVLEALRILLRIAEPDLQVALYFFIVQELLHVVRPVAAVGLDPHVGDVPDDPVDWVPVPVALEVWFQIDIRDHLFILPADAEPCQRHVIGFRNGAELYACAAEGRRQVLFYIVDDILVELVPVHHAFYPFLFLRYPFLFAGIFVEICFW